MNLSKYSVHNDSRTLLEIRRKNEQMVNRLVKVKPVISSKDKPKQYAHIKSNTKRLA
jgi:hypothetical protein